MSTDRSIRLLCTGDLHLGRRPSRTQSTADELSVEHVWQRIVDYAIDQRVDALVLTGDVVDAYNQYFEAYGALDRGLKRLKEARLPTYVVAGNHDYGVLPNLIDGLGTDHVHLLGRGGHWETALLERDQVLSFRVW